jgi:uncharacterized protein HemY
MMGKPPPSPPGVARKLDAVELRMGNLRRELRAERDSSVKAAILYHMGSLYEHELDCAAEAFDHYTQAFDTEPGFHPAAMARMRLAERGRNGAELDAICEARVEAAREPVARATALLDLALRSDDWARLLRAAIAESPDPVVPALILEWLAEARQDPEALRDALRTQAEHASDSNLGAALWLDLALAELDTGTVDAALDALERAAGTDALAWPARSLQRRIAREHERWDALVSASVSMAGLLERETPPDPLTLSVPEEERLPMAAMLWEQAASCSAHALGDTEIAAECLASALRLFPDSPALRRRALRLAEQSGQPETLEDAATWFRDTAPSDPLFVSREIRAALGSQDYQSALAFLREVAAHYPNSELAQAALEVALLRSDAGGERIERLRQSAESREGSSRAELLWRAARIAASDERASGQAQSLFSEAASASAELRDAVLRDAWGAAVLARDAQTIIARCDELLEHALDDDERALLSFCRYDATRNLVGDDERARTLLYDALSDPLNRAWAPHIALVGAEASGDHELLAEAYRALAEGAEGLERACCLREAGRTHAQRGDWHSAERSLRRALHEAPDDADALRLLEGVLREGGHPEAIVALAQSRAGDASSNGLGEQSLLLAGAAAERSGDTDAARSAYEEALRQSEGSPAAALALADLARRMGDESLRRRAYASLERSELGGGVPELIALLLGDSAQGERAAASYERALQHPASAAPAAAALLSMPLRATSDDARLNAEEAFADLGASLAEPTEGFGATYSALRDSLGVRGSSTGDAWLQLATVAPSESLRANTLLQGLRELRIDQGEGAIDELFMLAHDAEELASRHVDAAIAVDEVLAPGDDPELRASTLQHKLEHSADLGRGALEAALCRALVDAGRGAEAVVLLSRALDERPDDLASWETLRSAARQAGQWAMVAQACERLAPFVEGSLKADLLEEAGAVRLDCLQQYPQAEDLFRRALDEDPTRQVAFRRLHDLLAEREDAEALEALVSARLAIGGPKDRPELLYERARLLRGFSDRPGALEVLDELFAVEPEHAGALALAAEVHVSLEQWEEAVACLRRLARAGIPEGQRRVAHLGAADFLETHLGARDAALAELRAVEALGLADLDTWMRIGALEESFENPGAAIDAYQRIVERAPDHGAAVDRLAELLDGEEREALLRRHEDAIWPEIDAGELDEKRLERLRKAAHWRGQLERASAIAAVEAALEPGAPASLGASDLRHVSLAAIWDPDASTVIEEVIQRAGPSLSQERSRAKKLGPDAPVHAELERLSERFGARFASAAATDAVSTPTAMLDREGGLRWLVPKEGVSGLDAPMRFVAGRLAWAAPRGAAALLDDSPERSAGTLAALLRAARCRVSSRGPMLPAVSLKLRRAARKSVQEAVHDEEIDSASLISAARRLHRSADRAGLLACGDIASALRVVLGGTTTMTALRSSPRGLDLLRFWASADSPLWRDHG